MMVNTGDVLPESPTTISTLEYRVIHGKSMVLTDEEVRCAGRGIIGDGIVDLPVGQLEAVRKRVCCP
jgi:hypothetical protein